MTRKKVKLAFIANASSRRTTFRKRKNGVIKKMNELSTLCGITACAIIYSPYDSTPEVWPSNAGAQRVIDEFRALPEMDQHKRMVDQETFLRQRIAKEVEHLTRQKMENREQEMTEVMFHYLKGEMGKFDLNINDLNDLGYVIDQFHKDVNHRLEILANSGMEIGESSNAAPAGGVGTPTVVAATTTPIAMDSNVGSSSSAAAAAFFNPSQQHQYHAQAQAQQFRYPPAPHVGFNEQLWNLNMSQNQNQTQQQWFMEMMNHPEISQQQMGFTFMDENHHSRNHHEPHHQQIAGESITALTAVSSSIIPASTNSNHHYQPQPHIPGGSSTAPASVTDPNLTNNTWFR